MYAYMRWGATQWLSYQCKAYLWQGQSASLKIFLRFWGDRRISVWIEFLKV